MKWSVYTHERQVLHGARRLQIWKL